MSHVIVLVGVVTWTYGRVNDKQFTEVDLHVKGRPHPTTKEYAGVRRSTQEYAGVRRSTQEYAGVRRSTQEYAGSAREVRRKYVIDPDELRKVVLVHVTLFVAPGDASVIRNGRLCSTSISSSKFRLVT
jgi:hypothetical protein